MNKRIKKLAKFAAKLPHNRVADVIAITATVLFILAGIIVSVERFWQYEVFYYNFGVFDQAIWHVSRFQPPIIEHLLVGGKISLADHFDLSILLLAPVFWLTDRSEALLIIQAMCAGLAGFVVYKIGNELLIDKVLSLSVMFCYFFFIGIQNAVITDFQELTVMSLPITLTFYAIIKKRLLLFWVLFILTLGFKEVTFLLGIGIAVFIYFYNKQWRKHAFIAGIYSVLWGYISIKILIPYFSNGVYLHEPSMPSGIVNNALAMVDHPLKRGTLFFSQLEFGFLPLLVPIMWFVILQDYVLRFIPQHQETRWTLGLHYNAQVAPLLAIASLFALMYLLRFKWFGKIKYLVALLLFINAFIQFRFIQHGPFMLALNPVFYQHTKDFTFLNDLIAKVPKDASVMTQNNLGVRFDHQHFIYLRQNYEEFKPDYIVLDMREGQNPNDFLFSPSMPEFLETIKKDQKYHVVFRNGDQYIFKRK